LRRGMPACDLVPADVNARARARAAAGRPSA
jgi:hypothetical protein